MIETYKRLIAHCLVVIGFVLVSLFYFSPVLQGKKIFQSDIMHYIGMAQQQKDFAKQTGGETYWTNSAFSGMPTFQLGAKYPHNYIKSLDLSLRFLPRPADYLFLYFIGFYILMLSMKVDFKLAALGALAFGFSTYLIIILGVGHNAKAHAIAYMPLVLSGIVLAFNRKYILGFLLTTVALGLELVANHYQMTYYLLLLVIIVGITYFIDAYKTKDLPHFFKTVGLLSIAALLAVGLNATNLMATKEYVDVSTRGKSELTISPDGSSKDITTGLSREYITEYSYGIAEGFNLFIPKFMGGGSYENVGKDSETYKAYINLGASPIEALEASKNAPMYWGDQPIVEAPAYVGAVIIFLFVLGLFLVKGKIKWWLVAGTVLSLLLSYGKNLAPLTDFFIDYVPLYSKFRAVSSIQVLLELCIPILGTLALVELFRKQSSRETIVLNALKQTLFITSGICVFFLLFKSYLFDFQGIRDARYAEAYGQNFVNALIEDRKVLFTSDTIRSLILVVLCAGAIYLFLVQKLKRNFLIVLFGALLLFDLVVVDKQYVNNDDFVPATRVDKPYQMTAVDKEILKDKGHYRVFDMSSDGQSMPARAAYFHNSLMGYHAAKIGRYNDLLEFHIYDNNMEVLNMLNTKYIIIEDNGKVLPYTNTETNGNAWFINELQGVDSANAEIQALDTLKTKTSAVSTMIESPRLFQTDSTASIVLRDFSPNYLKYESNNVNKGFAVFSEIYYAKGWQAYINGEKVPHIRVNYVLRGLEVPPGNHIIEFKFEPKVVETGSQISLASSIVLGVCLVFGLFFHFRGRKPKAN